MLLFHNSLFSDGHNYADITAIIENDYGITITPEEAHYYATHNTNVRKLGKPDEHRILVINDLHIPFHQEDAIVDIITRHKGEISAIIFGGDIVDCESVSKFPKECRNKLIDEMIVTYQFLKRIDRLTPNVEKILIWGNHEYRFAKYMAELNNELNPLHGDNILQEIVGGFTHFDKMEKKKTVYKPLSGNFKVVNSWYIRYGDLIVAHPHNFSRVHLKTAVGALAYFLKKGLGFRMLLIGHTHKWGMTTDFGVVIGENGCLCKPMDYAASGNINYSPQEHGYSIITQKNGVTDINNSRMYRLDLEEGETEWLEVEGPS